MITTRTKPRGEARERLRCLLVRLGGVAKLADVRLPGVNPAQLPEIAEAGVRRGRLGFNGTYVWVRSVRP